MFCGILFLCLGDADEALFGMHVSRLNFEACYVMSQFGMIRMSVSEFCHFVVNGCE